MTSAGAVSTIGVRAFTPAVPANASSMRGSTGASSTAPSTARQLDSSRTTAWARPAGRPVAGSTATSPASGSSATDSGLTTSPTRASPLTRGAGPGDRHHWTESVRNGAGERKSLLLRWSSAGSIPARRPADGQRGRPHDEVAQVGVLGVVVEDRVPPHRLDQRADLDRRRQRPDAEVQRQQVDQPALQQRDPVAAGDQRRARSGSSR